MNDKKIAVIGAGPAGMTAAYQLTKRNISVDVYEVQDAAGGMSRTIPLWGQKVDIGSHRFFSSDPRVNALWLEMVGNKYDMVNRLSRIYYNRTFFNYPLQAWNALFGLGIFKSIHCIASYGIARIFPPKDQTTFQGWVTSRFGKKLFEIFFKSYSEKLWGITCTELDADFAAQRIKKFSLSEAIKSAFVKPGKGKHMTLVDQFAYPHDGTGYVYEQMADYVSKHGGRMLYNTPVRSVIRNGTSVHELELENGERKSYDHIISTMPLTLLVDRLDAPENVKQAARSLRFRNTIVVYLEIEGKNPFPDQWIYVHSPELRTGRVSNFRNWVPQLYGDAKTTILCLEYWCYDDDTIWKAPEEELIALATKEILHTGLIGSGKVLRGKIIRVPRCYPVYERGYKDKLKPVESYLRTLSGLSVIGRYGSFKYNNQDHSILMGIMAAQNLADGASHDLWAINTDYEYQEKAFITKTGLEKR